MREITEIVERVSRFEADERAVLATVVDVQGSGYRLPGARMLMLQDGGTVGMVSGGCLEADVLARAAKVLEKDRPEVFTYDTTKDVDSVFSLNMGCRGVVRIMLEPMARDNLLLRSLTAVRSDRRPRTIATVISTEPATDDAVGRRAILADGELACADLPASLQNSDELRRQLTAFHTSAAAHGFARMETADVSFELAFETLLPPVSLFLVGAGADAVPLANIASQLGWQVTVYDHRPAYLSAERFGNAPGLILHNDERPIVLPHGDSRTVAVIMTHNYQQDAKILPMLLKSDVSCIAALGPKRRTEQLLEESGETFTEVQLARLYAPAGLDIGAETPEAIALSIIAEIQGVLRSRDGGHLRDREGSIYDRK